MSKWNLSFRIYLFIATKRSQKTTIFFVPFSWGWNPLPGACSDLDIHKRDGKGPIDNRPSNDYLHTLSKKRIRKMKKKIHLTGDL